jgi:hypothetical protein
LPPVVDDFSVTQNIHVGGGRVEQHLLLDSQQVLVACRDCCFSLAHGIFGAEAVEHWLVERDLEIAAGEF